jgi:hypothetical protein
MTDNHHGQRDPKSSEGGRVENKTNPPVKVPNRRVGWRKQPQALTYKYGVDDPSEVILTSLGSAIENIPDIYGSEVLVATAPTPESYGLILRPDNNLAEGRYQGKVGMILGWGPTAFLYDPRYPSYKWEGPKPSIHDFVFYRTSDAWEVGVNGVSCRFITDDCIKGRVTDIEVIW